MTTENQLLPCPFCGAQPEPCDVSEYFVECPSCGLQGPHSTTDSRASAIEAWNRRTTTGALALPTTEPSTTAPNLACKSVQKRLATQRGYVLPTTQAQEQELMRVEIAGLSSTISHLSKLLDEQRALLVETEDVCGRDVYGAQFEDGDSSLIDKIRAHLAMTAAPDTEAQPGLFQDPGVIPKPNAQDHLPDAGKMIAQELPDERAELERAREQAQHFHDLFHLTNEKLREAIRAAIAKSGGAA